MDSPQTTICRRCGIEKPSGRWCPQCRLKHDLQQNIKLEEKLEELIAMECAPAWMRK